MHFFPIIKLYIVSVNKVPWYIVGKHISPPLKHILYVHMKCVHIILLPVVSGLNSIKVNHYSINYFQYYINEIHLQPNTMGPVIIILKYLLKNMEKKT